MNYNILFIACSVIYANCYEVPNNLPAKYFDGIQWRSMKPQQNVRINASIKPNNSLVLDWAAFSREVNDALQKDTTLNTSCEKPEARSVNVTYMKKVTQVTTNFNLTPQVTLKDKVTSGCKVIFEDKVTAKVTTEINLTPQVTFKDKVTSGCKVISNDKVTPKMYVTPQVTLKGKVISKNEVTPDINLTPQVTFKETVTSGCKVISNDKVTPKLNLTPKVTYKNKVISKVTLNLRAKVTKTKATSKTVVASKPNLTSNSKFTSKDVMTPKAKVNLKRLMTSKAKITSNRKVTSKIMKTKPTTKIPIAKIILLKRCPSLFPFKYATMANTNKRTTEHTPKPKRMNLRFPKDDTITRNLKLLNNLRLLKKLELQKNLRERNKLLLLRKGRQ